MFNGSAAVGTGDQLARDEALDTSRSVLVQAPAGSGKTELLALRFLKLLAEVERPDQILAVTFTVDATAEIRHRVLRRLEEARVHRQTGRSDGRADNPALQIAIAALENSDRRGWQLHKRPQDLQIQSIDALSLRIANQMPLSAKIGGIHTPTKVAAPLYLRAAQRTFDRLGGADHELNTALQSLLLLRSGNLSACELLVANMLATRDRWTHAFPLHGGIDWQAARQRLEEPFQREISRVLEETHQLLSSSHTIANELIELAQFACSNLDSTAEIKMLAGLKDLPPGSVEFLDHWRCLCSFVLNKGGEPWKKVDVKQGFPRLANQQKERFLNLTQDLADRPGVLDILLEIRNLPPPHYSEDQWENLRHIFLALRQAVEDLSVVFAEQQTVDYTEITMAALEVLRSDIAGASSLRDIRHLLVDEFQDTSRRQYDLITALLQDWQAHDETASRRTFFLVGDPMQSIYMFRNADVELFERARRYGFGESTPLSTPHIVKLTTNFRSNAGVVKPLNSLFTEVFPHQTKAGSAAVDFLPGVPADTTEPKGAFEIHASFLSKHKTAEGTEFRTQDGALASDMNQVEADAIVKILKRHLPRIQQARRQHQEYTVAVLGRAKNHLATIAATLRDENIPFRAVELEKLGQRQEVLDLLSLTRALLHPMDRIAWLSVLRAPWCGLSLRDLHLLCGTDENQYGGGAVMHQIAEHLQLLSDDSQERVSKLVSIMQSAAASRYRQPSFSTWIEATWTSLRGHECVDAAGLENAQAFFRMLDEISLDGIEANPAEMSIRLGRLFATPDPSAGERSGVQLMTMHKAKGLGFHVVVLPSLHRVTQRHTFALVDHVERVIEGGKELLVAPLGRTGDDRSALNTWVGKQRDRREAEERKRLLYVACTRARAELHLFATAKVENEVPLCPSGSLLETAWPGLRQPFVEALAQEQRAHPAILLPFPKDGGHRGVVASLAASGSKTRRYCLPAHQEINGDPAPVTATEVRQGEAVAQAVRPEGSRSSRILGTTVHALLEKAVKQIAAGATHAELLASRSTFLAQAAAVARQEGLPLTEAEACAERAITALHTTLSDPQGAWIMRLHDNSQTESSWTGILDGELRTLRIDRSFRAGTRPMLEGQECLWIIDYKTATHGAAGLADFLAAEKLVYATQLENYGRMLRLARGENLLLRLGLYYPFLKQLVWWEA